MSLSSDDIDRIAGALHVKLRAEREAHWIEPETHAEQHRFLQEWMQEKARARESRRRMKESVLGWLIITVIGGIVAAAGMGVYHWFITRLPQ